MIAQSKMLIFISLASIGWGDRLARALEGDGEGNAALMAWDGPPHLQETCTTEEFALIQREGTHDDLIRLAMTLPGSNPGPCCMRVVNCGQTLATMGRFKDFLPGAFSRVVTVLNSLGGSGGSTPLSPNTVYSLTVNPPAVYDFIISAGAAIGDQVDFTTENVPAGRTRVRILGSDSLTQLVLWDLETTDRVRYFTAVWNGTAWEVKQS